MTVTKSIIATVLFCILFDNHAVSSEAAPPGTNEDGSSIPVIASGKRMHNMMRFGKRDSGGENVLDFDKRENTKAPQHSFLYFGKRDVPPKKSAGNAHNILRFGKRTPDDIFGYGRQYDDDYYGYSPYGDDIDEDKRGGHSMMYFGKRTPGHNMLSFGKRSAGHNMLSFGKRPAGHNILSFGKRPAGHNILSFGKRTAGHSILSFGKRDDDKRAHSMIHFGKRDDDEDILEDEKRSGGHAMFHFGKRDESDDSYPDEIKRASHSMIHFGKRDFEDEPVPFSWNPAAYENEQQQNTYRYGKKTGGKNNHAMIHFGKRDDEKRAHAMIHFGKRSVDQDNRDNNVALTSNPSENAPTNAVSRMKRDLEAIGNPEPLVTLIRYGNNEEEDGEPEDDIENVVKADQTSMYYPSGIINPLPYADDPLLAISPVYRPLLKKEASKNMFMRFG